MEEIFNERTTRGFEKMIRRQNHQKLNRSKLFKLWVAFYSEWFNIQIESDTIIALDQNGNPFSESGYERTPGSTMVLVSNEITVQVILQKILDLHLWNESVTFPSEEIQEDREHPSRRLTYKKYCFTLLEELLLECFHYYQKGEFLPYGNRLIGTFFCRIVPVRIDGKRREVNIWSSSPTGSRQRTKIGIYIDRK